MTLRSRLSVGLVIITIILVLPLLFAIQSLYRLHDDAKALRDRDFAASLVIGRLREGLNDLHRGELALLGGGVRDDDSPGVLVEQPLPASFGAPHR